MSIPRADGQSRGRSFIPDQKLAHLAAYEQIGHERQGGAYLSLEGVYSSVMSKCGRLRDAGVLEGKTAGETLGRPSAERAEIAPTRRRRRAESIKQQEFFLTIDRDGRIGPACLDLSGPTPSDGHLRGPVYVVGTADDHGLTSTRSWSIPTRHSHWFGDPILGVQALGPRLSRRDCPHPPGRVRRDHVQDPGHRRGEPAPAPRPRHSQR